MTRTSEEGFGLVELMIAAGLVLALLSGTLCFFSRSQRMHTNERVTLDMAQDSRTAFDRISNELRMAGAGLPSNCAIVSGTATTLAVRGDFSNVTTIVSLATAPGVFSTGSTTGFEVGQTVSLLNAANLATSGQAALAKITAVDHVNNSITLNTGDMLSLTSGAQINDFGSGTMLNVIERRTYCVKASGTDVGNVTRTVSYEDTKSAGTTVQPEETIAANVLTKDGNAGLAFHYLRVNGDLADLDGAGQVIGMQVLKVEIDFDYRTANLDLASGEFTTLSLKTLVPVRGQYSPGL